MARSIDKKKKFSRKRQNEDEGDITYINERNRVFNKKVNTLPLPYHCFADSAIPDCTLLRQIHSRDQSQFRAWYCSVVFRPVFYHIYTFHCIVDYVIHVITDDLFLSSARERYEGQ